jgi:hypothetical protein
MDERIVAALAEPPTPAGASPAVVAMRTKLDNKLLEYDECVATSRSAEGLNLSMSIEAAAKQVAEYHAAYRRLLAAAAVAEGTNPALLADRRGYCVDFSNGQLHRL